MLGYSAKLLRYRANGKQPLLNFASKLFASSLTSINSHNNAGAAAPLIEHFRSRWPHAPIPTIPSGSNDNLTIPKQRMVPTSVLRFSFTATFGHGSSIYYSHLSYNPADFKVALKVR